MPALSLLVEVDIDFGRFRKHYSGMHDDQHFSRAVLYRSDDVAVIELSRRGPAEHHEAHDRPVQSVECATVMVARTGRAALAHTGRSARHVVAEPGRPIILHPGDTYRVRYPAPGSFRATVVVFPGRDATAAATPPRASRDIAHRDLADRACALLAADPAASHRLHDIARALGVSPFYLARIFHAQIGVSLHRYLLQIRLGLALEQIAAGERNLSTLALSLGFATHSHFSATFRRTIGSSPRAMREALARTVS